MNEAQVKNMVNRFLAWRLPDDFAPDAGISFKREFNQGTPYQHTYQPIGTNLFNASQAEAMVRHLVEGLAPSGGLEAVIAELERATVKFPTWPTDPLHALGVLHEEVGELSKEVLQLVYEPHKTSPDKVRAEAIQAAAMALRFAMSLDVYQYTPGEQHRQASALNPNTEPAN